jgi:hypothetical protein
MAEPVPVGSVFADVVKKLQKAQADRQRREADRAKKQGQ